jgi:poly(hydroxyalkanoate) granule-associated protein
MEISNESELEQNEIQKKQQKKSLKLNSDRKSVLDFRKYTKQIWLAGLGAFSRAEEEGNKLFDSLVEVGAELESKTTEIADQTVDKVTLKAKEQVVDTKDKVEKILDHGVNHSINKLGFATTKDLQHLERLVLQLHEKMDVLLEQQKNTSKK